MFLKSQSGLKFFALLEAFSDESGTTAKSQFKVSLLNIVYPKKKKYEKQFTTYLFFIGFWAKSFFYLMF